MKQTGGFGRIHLAQLLMLAVLIVVTAFALVPLQRAVDARMQQLKDQLITATEARLGRRVSYSSISPSIFRFLDIRGLRILGEPGERDVLIDVGQVKAYYNVLQLFSDHPLDALTELRLENSSIDLDYRRDQDVLDFVRQTVAANGARQAAGAVEIPLDLRIRGENMSLRYQGPTDEYRAQNLGFVVTVRDGETALALGGNFGSLHRDGGSWRAEGASIDGSWSDAASHARLLIDVPRLQTAAATVVDQTFQLDYDGRTIDVHKVRDRSPIDLSLKIDPVAATVQVDFLTDGMIPANVVQLHGPLAVFNPWLLGETSGQGRLNYSLTTQDLSYDLRISNRVRNPEIAEPIAISLAVQGDTRSADIESFSVRSSQGQALFSGAVDLVNRVPHGDLLFEGFSYDGIGPLSASFSVGAERGWTTLRSEVVRYGQSRFYDVELAMRQEGDRSGYSALAFLDSERRGWVELSGQRGAVAESGVEMLAEFRNAPLDAVIEVAADLLPGFPRDRVTAVAGGSVLDTRVRASTAGQRLRVEAPFVSLYDPERPDRYAAFGFYAGEAGFEVRNAVVASGEYLLRGGLLARVANDQRIDFQAEFLDGLRRYEVEGLVDNARTVVFRGSHGLDGRLHVADNGEVVYSARAQQFPLPFSDNGARVTFDLSGIFRSFEQWDVSLRKLELGEVRLGKHGFTVDLSGRFNAAGGRIERLTYSDAVSRVSGSGTAEYNLLGGGGASLLLNLNALDTPERYELQATLDAGELTAALVFESSPLARSTIEGIRGSVNGVMTLDGLLSDPRMSADFQVVDGAVNNDAFSANGRVTYSDQVITLETVRGQYVTNSLSGGRGTIDLRNSTIDLQATVRNSAQHRAQPRTLRVRSQLESDEPQDDLFALLAGPFRGRVRIEGLDILPRRYGDWDFSVDRSAERIVVSGGPSDAMSAIVHSNGQFRIELLDPLPIRFVAAGSLQNGDVEANITQVLVQIDEVPDLFDLGALSVQAGRISGGIRLVGQLSDPDLYGTLTADGVRANLDLLRDPIGPAKIYLVLQEKQLRLTPFTTAVGSGSGTVSGTIVLHRWGVDEFQLDIESGESGVPVAHTFGGLSVDGYAAGRMRIAGSPGFLSITGDIEARATTLAVSTRDQPREPGPDSMTTVDLNLRTGRRVEFLWPSREFPVVRSFAQANEQLQLHYSDESGTFRLRGNVGIQGGEIYYFDRNFYIREGQIVFDETEELFDPRLRARAELREVGREGPVRIFLIADGSRLSEFSPRFESSPTMSDSEIATLIGGGLITGGPDDVFNISTAMLATTDIVTPFGIMNNVETSIRDALGLDLFSVRTQLFQNLVVGALEEPAQEPLDNNGRSLGQYLDNTTVFLGKYLGSSLFLELLVQIRARNPLEPQGESLGGIEVDAELGLEFQTPFFDLQWSVFPQNPQTLFVSDTTFSFSWGFSY